MKSKYTNMSLEPTCVESKMNRRGNWIQNPTVTWSGLKAILEDAIKNMSPTKKSKINPALTEVQAAEILLKGLKDSDDPANFIYYNNTRVLLLGKKYRRPKAKKETPC